MEKETRKHKPHCAHHRKPAPATIRACLTCDRKRCLGEASCMRERRAAILKEERKRKLEQTKP